MSDLAAVIEQAFIDAGAIYDTAAPTAAILAAAQPEPAQPDGLIQAQVGLADTPLGQKVAITLVILLGRDAAATVAEHVAKVAEQMSGSGLIVAAPGMNGTAQAPG